MNRRSLLLCTIVLASALTAPSVMAEDGFRFHLHGGFFYGPGPIKPDTALPDGDIAGIDFDTVAMRGLAKFRAAAAPLSDGKTYVNANIDAGRLGIGENKQVKTFWLTAVDGGPRHGTETYEFDAAGNFVWTVDLALDPGFAEGIIRVDGFKLTTGWVQVHTSLQSTDGAPGGFDKAGSQASGEYLVGRVGDFDRDGYLDGVLVASANVPMASDMLPGAPVANMRGFTSNIPVAPAAAAEMTLAGVDNMHPLVDQLIKDSALPRLTAMLADIGDRIDAASLNCEDAFLKGDRQHKQQMQEIRWRITAARKLFFIPWAFLTGYPAPAGKVAESVKDSTRRGFEVVHDLLPRLRAIDVAAAGGVEKTQ